MLSEIEEVRRRISRNNLLNLVLLLPTPLLGGVVLYLLFSNPLFPAARVIALTILALLSYLLLFFRLVKLTPATAVEAAKTIDLGLDAKERFSTLVSCDPNSNDGRVQLLSEQAKMQLAGADLRKIANFRLLRTSRNSLVLLPLAIAAIIYLWPEKNRDPGAKQLSAVTAEEIRQVIENSPNLPPEIIEDLATISQMLEEKGGFDFETLELIEESIQKIEQYEEALSHLKEFSPPPPELPQPTEQKEKDKTEEEQKKEEQRKDHSPPPQSKQESTEKDKDQPKPEQQDRSSDQSDPKDSKEQKQDQQKEGSAKKDEQSNDSSSQQKPSESEPPQKSEEQKEGEKQKKEGEQGTGDGAGKGSQGDKEGAGKQQGGEEKGKQGDKSAGKGESQDGAEGDSSAEKAGDKEAGKEGGKEGGGDLSSQLQQAKDVLGDAKEKNNRKGGQTDSQEQSNDQGDAPQEKTSSQQQSGSQQQQQQQQTDGGGDSEQSGKGTKQGKEKGKTGDQSQQESTPEAGVKGEQRDSGGKEGDGQKEGEQKGDGKEDRPIDATKFGTPQGRPSDREGTTKELPDVGDKGGGTKALPDGKRVEVPKEEEQLKPQHLGGEENKLYRNQPGSKARTAIGSQEFEKPKAELGKSSQPIPVEYQDLL